MFFAEELQPARVYVPTHLLGSVALPRLFLRNCKTVLRGENAGFRCAKSPPAGTAPPLSRTTRPRGIPPRTADPALRNRQHPKLVRLRPAQVRLPARPPRIRAPPTWRALARTNCTCVPPVHLSFSKPTPPCSPDRSPSRLPSKVFACSARHDTARMPWPSRSTTSPRTRPPSFSSGGCVQT